MSRSLSLDAEPSARSNSAGKAPRVDVALGRVHLAHPVTCPRLDGRSFESATAQYHVNQDLRGAGRCEAITLRGGFVVLQMPRCMPTEVPLAQVVWMVRA